MVKEEKRNNTPLVSDSKNKKSQSTSQPSVDPKHAHVSSRIQSENSSKDSTSSDHVEPMTENSNVTVNTVARETSRQRSQPSAAFSIRKLLSFRTLLYVLLMYNLIRKKSDTSKKSEVATGSKHVPMGTFHNVFQFGELLDFYIYLDESPSNTFNEQNLLWKTSGQIVYGEKNNLMHHAIVFPSHHVLKENGTLYAHMYVTRFDISPSPHDSSHNPLQVVQCSKLLTRFQPKLKPKNVKHLLNNSFSDENHYQEYDTRESSAFSAYWARNLSIALINDKTVYSEQHLRTPVANFVQIQTDGSSYLPSLAVNDFWLLSSSLMPMEEKLDLFIDISTMSLTKWMIYTQLSESFQLQEQMFGVGANDFDDIKTMLLETKPWLLCITVIVTLLHSLFDFLAFRNDVSFWKGKKNSEGLSLRSVLVNVFFQAVILLYLHNNDTSFMVLASTAVGLAIEVWKIFHVASFEIQRKENAYFPYRIRLQERESTAKSDKTREYDDLAFRYLSYVLYPLAVGYAIYSLKYEQHKNWYSWILSSLVGFIYSFGFIMMTPQLFINYKLKSIAHMPWKTFTYKAINTFIDDLFAFIIKMPFLHRLACLRDDVIFVIYLYQRWIYPVDKTRANEFGQIGVEENELTSTNNLPKNPSGTDESSSDKKEPYDVNKKMK